MNLILISAIWGVIMMFSGLFLKSKSTAKNVALIGAVALFIGSIFDLNGKMLLDSNFRGMLQFDRFGLLYLSILSIALVMYLLLSGKDVETVGKHPFEYFALIFFVMSGAGLVSLYNNLLILFIGIEIISIPLYILTASDKRNLKGNEAALKYFLMGAFSTGIMLLGIAFLYGAAGSFQLEKLAMLTSEETSAFSVIGIVMIMVALAFKVSAAQNTPSMPACANNINP